MFSPDAGFPLKLDPSEDESGLGYCLRVASSNGANLFTLKRFLGIRESKQITREHAYALSGLLEGRQDWLQSRLIESYGIHHGPRSYCGHSVYVHNHLRFRRPQVCPLCVHNPGYCSAIWDFSLSTLCSKHHCALVDTCAKCGKALDWNRPSVDVNACSHYVEAAKHPKPIDACLWELQALVDAKFRKENMAAISTAAVGWRALTAGLTLGGLHSVIAAFGMHERALIPGHSVMLTMRLSTPIWQQVALRAISRMEAMASGLISAESLADEIWQPGLMWMLHPQADSSDQQVAQQLLEGIYGRQIFKRLHQLHPHLAQQALF